MKYLINQNPGAVIPDWTGIPNTLDFREAPDMLSGRFTTAKTLARKLCQGNAPARPKCPLEGMPVCGEVTITVKCNSDMTTLMKSGKDLDGAAIPVNPFQKSLCGIGTEHEGSSVTTVSCKGEK